MVKVSCAFVGLDTFHTHHRRTASAPSTPARRTSVPRCTSPPPSTYHTLSLEPTTLYLNDYPSEKSPMHLQQGGHLTLTNFQRLYLYTSDSYISFPLNRHEVFIGYDTSAEHQEAPPCDLDWLPDVTTRVRLWVAGKALPRYLVRLYIFYLTVVTSARG